LLIENFGKKFSISKAYNYFKSLGISKSKKTIWNYLKYFNAPEIRGKILSMLREYIDFGGFPEVVLSENKRDLLKSYIDTIFYKDVVDRYKIRDIKSCEIFLKLLIENFGKKFSISKAYNYFKSLGISKSKKTIWNYLKYFNEAFFVIPLEKFSFSLRERLQYPIKLYSVDTGFYMREDFGLKMGNLVSVALAREESECYYFQTKNGYEIDFLIKNGGRIEKLIQVTFANSFDEIDRREYIALIHAQELFKNDQPKCMIITRDYEDEKELKWFGKSAKIKICFALEMVIKDLIFAFSNLWLRQKYILANPFKMHMYCFVKRICL